jgi:hypothetical protein
MLKFQRLSKRVGLFDIPASNRPSDGKLTFYAAKKSAYLLGKQTVQLGNNYTLATTISLTKDSSAMVQGRVVDDSGRAIAGARVSVVGHETETITTKLNGKFALPAHTAWDETIRLHIEKEGYGSVDQYHPAGEESATIVLTRR